MDRIAANDPRLAGHPMGGLYIDSNSVHSLRITIRSKKTNTFFGKSLHVNDFGNNMITMTAVGKAILQQESDARNLTRNKCIVLENGNVEMILTQGYKMQFAPEKLDLLAPHIWSAHESPDGGVYAFSEINGKCIYCHRLLMNAQPGQIVDHKRGTLFPDGITLDNTMSNLRFTTRRGNNQNRKKQTNNTSGVVGVSKIMNKNGNICAYQAKWSDKEQRECKKKFHVNKKRSAEEALAAATHLRYTMEDMFGMETRRRMLTEHETMDAASQKRQRDDDNIEEEEGSAHVTKKQRLMTEFLINK